MRAAVWVSKGGSFPSLYRGFLVTRGAGKTVTLMLTDCEKHTWANYHGTVTTLPLWEKAAVQIFYDVSLSDHQVEGKQKYEAGDVTLTVELLPENVVQPQ